MTIDCDTSEQVCTGSAPIADTSLLDGGDSDRPLTPEERRVLVMKPFPIVKSYSGCSHGGTAGADVVSGQETADSIWSRRWGKRFGGRKPSMSEYENSSD